MWTFVIENNWDCLYRWCWSWNSNTLATWWEELTHLKRPWCWERLRAGGEGDDRGWNGWMASLTQWTWVWVNSWSWWWTGRPGVLRFMRSQRVGQDWATELNWTDTYRILKLYLFISTRYRVYMHTYQVNFEMMWIFVVGVNVCFESTCFLVTIARFRKFLNWISMILNIY